MAITYPTLILPSGQNNSIRRNSPVTRTASSANKDVDFWLITVAVYFVLQCTRRVASATVPDTYVVHTPNTRIL